MKVPRLSLSLSLMQSHALTLLFSCRILCGWVSWDSPTADERCAVNCSENWSARSMSLIPRTLNSKPYLLVVRSSDSFISSLVFSRHWSQQCWLTILPGSSLSISQTAPQLDAITTRWYQNQWVLGSPVLYLILLFLPSSPPAYIISWIKFI